MDDVFRQVSPQVRLFPYGKSGLKFGGLLADNAQHRLFPYGKSGLKSEAHGRAGHGRGSLPVWEEWIEILRVYLYF